MPSRTRTRFFQLGLLAGSILFTLSLLEALLRVLSPSPYYGQRTIAPQETFFRYDSLLGWRGIPNIAGPFYGPDFSVNVTLDRHGYRNMNPQFVEGKKNVLVLGDSYGWGWGVEDDEMFHSRLMVEDTGLNVYNLSAPGYGTDQEYLTLREYLRTHEGQRYAGAILLFYLNDFEDTTAAVRYGYQKPMFELSQDGVLSMVNVPVPKVARQNTQAEPVFKAPTWLNGFHAYNFLSFRIDQLFASPGNMPEPVEQVRHGLEPTLALIEEMAELNRNHDMFFHVVILMTSNVDKAAWQWEPLKEFLVSRDIGHSSFHSSALPDTDLWLDGHLSRHGHAKLTDHLLSVLSGLQRVVFLQHFGG